MSDIECPYCEKECEVNHDDGFGYEEDVPHQTQCNHCDKEFVFYTSISFDYDAKKANCLNGESHDYQLSHTIPKEFSRMCCSMCGDYRELTDDERQNYGIRTRAEYFESFKRKENP